MNAQVSIGVLSIGSLREFLSPSHGNYRTAKRAVINSIDVLMSE